ncbi:enoyl-CoA hydratase/carnithine racemase [Bradyrhizobium sp. USDA 4472]
MQGAPAQFDGVAAVTGVSITPIFLHEKLRERAMDLKFSKVERKGPITIVTLSRPEVYNALHIDAHFELNKVFDDFAADPAQWVAVVTGAGDKAFCAGNDLKWQAAGGKRGWDKGGFAGLTARFDCDKPIIAAVNGVAMGGGFEIALACDLIIASENATFALPEPRVGLAALAGGLHRLPRQIGLKRAMGMILTARHVSAAEGKELGFINEVVPQGEALAGALRWAEMITRNSPMSIRASKQAIQKGLGVSLEQAIEEQREYPAVKAMVASQDYIEGPKAFSEKRPPNWVGK